MICLKMQIFLSNSLTEGNATEARLTVKASFMQSEHMHHLINLLDEIQDYR